MKLTPLGAQVLTMGDKERLGHGQKLLKGGDLKKYVVGVCFESAGYVRALLGTTIAPNDVLDTSGPDNWYKKLGVAKGKEWDGKTSLKPGQTVGFFRTRDKKFFHVGIATGSSKIRATNGLLLGNGWTDEVDLKKVLKTPDSDGLFDYDNNKIKVFVVSKI